jgi:hypothetical protein
MNSLRTPIIVVLCICLGAAIWAILQLIGYHEQNTETVVFTDSPIVQIDQRPLRCNPGRRKPELDIRDYSYNVTRARKPSGLYRYKSSLVAEPPVDIHVLLIRGGSGRVMLERSEKPTWLVLLSTQAAIWHIEQSPGAKLERVITNQRVSEIRFAGSLSNTRASALDLLLHRAPVQSELPQIDVMPHSICLSKLLRFQKFHDLKSFVPALDNLRAWLGHPERSFQTTESPSYFDLPFRVPFDEPEISIERLAAVKKLAEPPPRQANSRRSAPPATSPSASDFEQYANMERRNDVVPKTLSTPAEFLSTLEEYQRKNLLPSELPRSGLGSKGVNVAGWYSLSGYKSSYTRRVPEGVTEDACNGGRDGKLLIVEGTDASNIVKCAYGNQLYFMKGGDDRIDDSWEDDIINAGPGDDIIKAGWGNDIVFFNYGWGQDTVDKTCHNSAYIPQDAPRSSEIRWSREWAYKSFLVFGKDILREDIVSVNDKLVHKKTGDSITLKGNCFNIVFW